MFYIEEIQEEEALYAYKGNCGFDELLEFYAFLNVWAVSEVELDDTSELYFRSMCWFFHLFSANNFVFVIDNYQYRIICFCFS